MNRSFRQTENCSQKRIGGKFANRIFGGFRGNAASATNGHNVLTNRSVFHFSYKRSDCCGTLRLQQDCEKRPIIRAPTARENQEYCFNGGTSINLSQRLRRHD